MRKILLLTIVCVLSFTALTGSAFATHIIDNDLNNDGITDSVYKDTYAGGKQFYAVKAGPTKGERVGVLASYARSPFWNESTLGDEWIRIFTDTVGVQRELNALSNTVYPEAIYGKYKLGDANGVITNIYPLSDGNWVWNLAKAAIDLINLSPTGQILTQFAITLFEDIGDYSTKNAYGDYAQEAYNSVWYGSRSLWLNNSTPTDLPSTVMGYDAYKYTANTGVVFKFEYQDKFWTYKSAHTVEPIANIKYVMTLQSSGLPYAWWTGTFSVPHNTYGG